MFDKFYAFDADKMADMFKTADMTKFFETAKMPMVDMDAVMATQQKNMEAFVEANKAAAAGYQELFKAQVSMIEETMASVQKQISELKMDQMTSEGAARQIELMKEGFEKALSSLTELGEMAQKTNSETFEIMRARVQASLDEMKDLAAKAA
ncbi:MAG: TIGR01841 family phasin [Pseudomonadota bacterium]